MRKSTLQIALNPTCLKPQISFNIYFPSPTYFKDYKKIL
ncbi:hypothetical protein D1AOALGA4SA_3727 [Olavius algarvensis Delta 1 endosymbiont]|nr:hypothetical protein D1AOALGA4SA_3727 [Olavius algarvensis Delta 1 endosymbiont]